MAWTYRKKEPSHIRGLCCRCDKNPQKRKSNGKYQTLCSYCEQILYKTKKEKPSKSVVHDIKLHKGNYCEACGFEAIHSCQLDMDHIDGDHSNNSPDNLQTLCANCHRYKTWVSRDWETKV